VVTTVRDEKCVVAAVSSPQHAITLGLCIQGKNITVAQPFKTGTKSYYAVKVLAFKDIIVKGNCKLESR